MFGSGPSILIALLLFSTAFILLVMAVTALVHRLLPTRIRRRLTLPRFAALCAVLVVVLTVVYAHLSRPFCALSPQTAIVGWAEDHLGATAAALDRHRAANGRYPADLGPVRSTLPEGGPSDWGAWPTLGGYPSELHYLCLDGGGSCVLGVVAYSDMDGFLIVTGPDGPPEELPRELAEFEFLTGTRGRWAIWHYWEGEIRHAYPGWLPWWFPQWLL
jgi:hypothetical protein